MDIVGYLTYVGASSMEQILVAQRRGLDTKHGVRTNHLVVRAINEILLMIRHLSSSPLVPEERQHMKTLQSESKKSQSTISIITCTCIHRFSKRTKISVSTDSIANECKFNQNINPTI